MVVVAAKDSTGAVASATADNGGELIDDFNGVDVGRVGAVLTGDPSVSASVASVLRLVRLCLGGGRSGGCGGRGRLAGGLGDRVAELG